MTAIEKLLSISSEPLQAAPPFCPDILRTSQLGNELFEMLGTKNGFYAFESSLHVFPLGRSCDNMDLESWNSPDLWRSTYGELAQGLLFFAEDVFQDQFCFSETGVHRFNAETSEKSYIGSSLEAWAKQILDNYEFETGWSIGRDWQAANGPLLPGQRLMPKTPFMMGGEYALSNLWAGESVAGMRFKGDLVGQTKHLREGTSINLNIRTPTKTN